MPSAKLTSLVDLAGGQVPTDLAYVVDVSAGVSGSKKSTLNDLFAIITKNITDGAVRWQGFAAPAVSASDQGSLYFDSTSDTFQGSRNGSAYDDLLFGDGSNKQVTVWSSLADKVVGYATLTYESAIPRVLLMEASDSAADKFKNSFSSATVPKQFISNPDFLQIFAFEVGTGGGPAIQLFRGASGPALPTSGQELGRIEYHGASSVSAGSSSGGVSLVAVATENHTGSNRGIGFTISTSQNGATVEVSRIIIHRQGAVMIGANGQTVSTSIGTATQVVIGTPTTYGSNTAIQIANPFVGNDNITCTIQANLNQTQPVFQLQNSSGTSLYSVGAAGTHTYLGITGAIAVSPAGSGRIYFESSTGTFKVSQNGGAYVDMIGSGVAGSNSQIQFNNSSAFGASANFTFDSGNNRLQLGVASSATGQLRFAVSGDANVTTFQAGDAPASDVLYKWPADDPAANDVLTVTSFSGGTAVLEWAPGAAGGVTGSGTAAQVAIWTGTSAIGGDAAFVYDSTNNRLVVGGASGSVAVTLNVRAQGANDGIIITENFGNDALLAFNNSGDSAARWTLLSKASTGNMEFFAPGNGVNLSLNKNAADGSGGVSIATTTGDSKLHVYDNTGGPGQSTPITCAVLNADNTSFSNANGSGPRLEFKAKSSTTSHRSVAAVTGVWASVTDASRQGAVAIQTVENAGSLTEHFRFAGLSAANGALMTQTGVNGSASGYGQISENVTLDTGGTTTDSTIDLPANSIILAVTARITTTITTATDWSVGDPTTAARFISANSTLTAGTTAVGLNQMQGGISTDAAGPVQTAAAKVRITTTGTPGAGAIRITIHYIQLIAPTS